MNIELSITHPCFAGKQIKIRDGRFGNLTKLKGEGR